MTPAPRTGTEFAGYRIDGLLGRGGMGVVYRAVHPRLGVKIALKLMAPEYVTDESFRERFVREARVAAGIGHPNIVPVYDAGEWQGDLYIAMRYIKGQDLGALVRARGVLTIPETYAIALQIASALDAAHRSGLVHRDVKPANILLEAGPDPDSPPFAYLADLGLSKEVSVDRSATASGELLGTIDYMAPEQISGSPVDGRTDVYSLACVLFECLTGSVPFSRENKAAILWAHLNDEVPRASAENPGLPSTVDAALARGMSKQPEDRFATARALVTALGAPLDAPTSTEPDEAGTVRMRDSKATPAPPARGAGRRRPRMRLVVAAAVGALLVGGIAAAVVLLVGGPDPSASGQTGTGATSTASTDTSAGDLTAFDQELLRYVPGAIRSTCDHATPLKDEFDATVSCQPGGVVDSLTYSHARSGQYLYQFLNRRRAKAGLPKTVSAGSCKAGLVPSMNDTIAVGFRGRAESEPVPTQVRLGRLLCVQDGESARIEWLTREVAIFAIAKGTELGTLYDWWAADAGPEP
jgi:Protein kinase domain